MSDGKWRALDTVSLRAVLGALQAIAATSVECELTREFGVEWIPRADGRGNEIRGVTQAQMDAYSTRTVQVHEKERELARAWERKHGRAPTPRELLHIASDATLLSRQGKDAEPIDWDALAARWDATLGGELAGIAPAVSNARGPDADTQPQRRRIRAPGAPPSREAQARALAKALTLVSDRHPAWTRHDLLKQLALVMPPQTRRWAPEEAQELLHGLADEALSGRMVRWCAWRRPSGRRSRHLCAASWTAAASTPGPGPRDTPRARSCPLEEQLLAHAQTRERAAPVRASRAARRLGADAAPLDAQLRGRARRRRASTMRRAGCDWTRPPPSGTSSPRPAPSSHHRPGGTGKTRVLASRRAGPSGRPGVRHRHGAERHATSCASAGVQVAENTTRLFADLRPNGRIPPGVADRDRRGVHDVHRPTWPPSSDYAARNGCKLMIAGDQEQLAAVEGGGGMMLLAGRLGLCPAGRAGAVRRRMGTRRHRCGCAQGDASALDEYDQHGRIRGAAPEQAMDQAACAYVGHYLAGPGRAADGRGPGTLPGTVRAGSATT